jgi:spoIIIJ-associated protein
MKTVTAKGKTVEEAIQNALKELNATSDMVTTKVLDMPASGLGSMLGGKMAKVEVTLNDAEIIACKEFLRDIFTAMDVEADINAHYEEDILMIEMGCEDTGVLIGRRGQTLDALQYLTSLVINKHTKNYTKISLDIEGYREKRKNALQDLADRIALKVEMSRTKYVLEPMNPYERRIIHSALQSYKNIVTYSEGTEPYRHVVIDYKRDI